VEGESSSDPGAPIAARERSLTGWFFVFFVISGFCGLLYELVWLRLSMAAFGVTTAQVSIVLSIFMAGLGLGALGGGRLSRRAGGGGVKRPLRLYAAIELLIGVSALLVPRELEVGRRLLQSVAISHSPGYYLGTGAWMALSLLPWCACMGATFPIAMAALRSGAGADGDTRRRFSYLYVANLAGAVGGATLPLLLIEVLGFHGTLRLAAILNGSLAAAVLLLGASLAARTTPSTVARALAAPRPGAAGGVGAGAGAGGLASRAPVLLLLLFLTGLTSMAMEVVWIRQLTPYLGTVVYAFGLILAVYLTATFVGARTYRAFQGTATTGGGRRAGPLVWSIIGLAALIPVLAADPWFPHSSSAVHSWRWLRLMGIGPASGLFGFVTPMLVDRWAGSDPERAGSAYAVNILGCIVGPLLASFLLLPWLSERWALLILASPWLLVGLVPTRPRGRWLLPVVALGLGLGVVLISRGYEDQFPQATVRRDSTATVVAGWDQDHYRLIVNGQGMTYLTPVTKMMAHLPLASLDHLPTRGLVICFGMGTTFRSMLSWGISTTVAELVPSVLQVAGTFHPDAPRLLQSPLARLVVDDGRRFLERTPELFDVITIDPPPPVGAAGSSLLYSREFYAIARRRLAPGGILQQWLPEGDEVVKDAMAGALRGSFAEVRVFLSSEGAGWHFLASDRSIARRSASELLARMPPAAVRDLIEWGPDQAPERHLTPTLAGELPLSRLVVGLAAPLQDERPVNEYYLLRRLRARLSP
jgi:predicted membrane-bound spermidine synthase